MLSPWLLTLLVRALLALYGPVQPARGRDLLTYAAGLDARAARNDRTEGTTPDEH
ncbi:hypothetical protein [Streptomyces smyrnaeus]|uniref:hypothetical protein n=1 Tax=Streptomyces smyrnaeus TaxID=1387713 RepID=UPI0036B4AC42